MTKKEISLQERINEFLLKEQTDRDNRQRSGKFSPSMFGRCFKAQILNRANVKQTNPPDERALRIFKVGHIFHDFVQRFIPDSQIEVETGEDDVRGFADIVSQDCVYDIKSQHSRAFWYQEKVKQYDIKKEKYNNWLQVAYYAIKLNKPKICLAFISKDDLCITEYLDFTKKWVMAVNKELKTLRERWQGYKTNKELLKGEPRCYNGKECEYCGWQDICEDKIIKKKGTKNSLKI